MIKNLFKNTFNFGIGSLLPQLIGFLLIPLYTSYLSPEDYGVIDIVGTLSGFLIIIMRLGMPGAIVRFFFDYNEDPDELRNYITTIHTFLLWVSSFISVLALLLGYFFLENFYPQLLFFPFFIYAVFSSAVSSNTDIQRRLIQARQQSAYSAKLNIILTVLSIIMNLFFVAVLKMGLNGIIIASTIGTVITFIQSQNYLKKDIKGKFDFKYLKPTFRYASGVLPSHMITPAYNLISRTVLLNYNGIGALGIFSLASRFTSPLILILGAFQTAYQPLYYSIRKKQNTSDLYKITDLIKKIWFLATVIYISIFCFIPPLIRIMTPEKFDQSAILVPLLSITFLLGTLDALFSLEIYYSKQTKWVSIISVLRLIAGIGILYLTISKLGVYSLVIASIAETLVTTSISLTVSFKLFHFDRKLGFVGFSTVIMSILLLIFYFLTPRLNDYFIIISGFIVLGCYTSTLILTKQINLRNSLNFILKKA